RVIKLYEFSPNDLYKIAGIANENKSIGIEMHNNFAKTFLLFIKNFPKFLCSSIVFVISSSDLLKRFKSLNLEKTVLK
ncbi:hypothetical protein NL317_32560, partial [Klebsiella pneumoniae]|nr:hypothetical protein [Klebsiella pneumoniae]